MSLNILEAREASCGSSLAIGPHETCKIQRVALPEVDANHRLHSVKARATGSGQFQDASAQLFQRHEFVAIVVKELEGIM